MLILQHIHQYGFLRKNQEVGYLGRSSKKSHLQCYRFSQPTFSHLLLSQGNTGFGNVPVTHPGLT